MDGFSNSGEEKEGHLGEGKAEQRKETFSFFRKQQISPQAEV